MTREKINWIENLKVLGILAVILGHIASPLGEFIFSWHMPLFFIIAGFFINFDLSLGEYITKNFKRLMIPYFLFALIGVFATFLKNIFLAREQLEVFHELKGIFIWMDMTSLMNSYAFVLWFLPALFFSKVLFYIINKYIINIFIQLTLIIGLFYISFYIEVPFGIDNALNAMPFLFIGNKFFKSYQKSKLLYVLPFLIICLFFIFEIPLLDMASKNFNNVIINILWSISIIYFFILVLKKIKSTNYLFQLWASNTMLLFIIHPYTNNIANIGLKLFSFNYWYLELILTLTMLQIILILKSRYNKGIFKYV